MCEPVEHILTRFTIALTPDLLDVLNEQLRIDFEALLIQPCLPSCTLWRELKSLPQIEIRGSSALSLSTKAILHLSCRSGDFNQSVVSAQVPVHLLAQAH